MGKARPIASNQTEAGRFQNRRVVFFQEKRVEIFREKPARRDVSLPCFSTSFLKTISEA